MTQPPPKPVHPAVRRRAGAGVARRDCDQAHRARARPQGRHRARLPGAAHAAEPDRSTRATSIARSRSSASAPTASAWPSRRSRVSATTRSGSAFRTSRTPTVPSRRSARRPSSISTTGSRTSSANPDVANGQPGRPGVQPASTTRSGFASKRKPECVEQQVHDQRAHLLPVRQPDQAAGSRGRPTKRRTSSSTRTDAAAQGRARDRRRPAGHPGGRGARTTRSASTTEQPETSGSCSRTSRR